jgi:hypothetical protein
MRLIRFALESLRRRVTPSREADSDPPEFSHGRSECRHVEYVDSAFGNATPRLRCAGLRSLSAVGAGRAARLEAIAIARRVSGAENARISVGASVLKLNGCSGDCLPMPLGPAPRRCQAIRRRMSAGAICD